jgi:hypothetical protein
MAFIKVFVKNEKQVDHKSKLSMCLLLSSVVDPDPTDL